MPSPLHNGGILITRARVLALTVSSNSHACAGCCDWPVAVVVIVRVLVWNNVDSDVSLLGVREVAANCRQTNGKPGKSSANMTRPARNSTRSIDLAILRSYDQFHA